METVKTMEEKNFDEIKDAVWYSKDGVQNDIVIYTQVALSRNLARTCFVPSITKNDAAKVREKIFSAFGMIKESKSFRCFPMEQVDEVGRQILTERFVLPDMCLDKDSKEFGVITHENLSFFATVNVFDHLVLMNFSSGLAIEKTFLPVKALEEELEDILAFSYSKKFGFRTANFCELGSGLRVAVAMELPALSRLGMLDGILESIRSNGERVTLVPLFYAQNSANDSKLPQSRFLGDFYVLHLCDAISSTEDEQLQQVNSAAIQMISAEFAAREVLMSQHETLVRNQIYRAVSTGFYSKFLSNYEVVRIVSDLKLGLSLKIIRGVTQTTLSELLFRSANGNIQFIIKTNDINFPNDIRDTPQKISYMRALVVQDALSKVEFNN